MTETFGKIPETGRRLAEAYPVGGRGVGVEPALARILVGNSARKAEMAAELAAGGFSGDQIRRLLHLEGGGEVQQRVAAAVEE